MNNQPPEITPENPEPFGIKDVLKIRDFRLLWLGQVISNFGDSLTALAVLLLINKITDGSTSAVALGAIVQALPQVTIGLLAGVYVDRLDRKRIMIISDLLRGVMVLGFIPVASPDTLWLLYLIAFVQASVGAFFTPARTAFMASEPFSHRRALHLWLTLSLSGACSLRIRSPKPRASLPVSSVWVQRVA
jgi:MFS family permease